MRREFEAHGEETLRADKMTFSDLADRYEKANLFDAKFQNGVKVAGRRSVASPLSALKSLREYFGKKKIRTIKASDLETYKRHRLETPVIRGKDEKGEPKKSDQKLATVNRELQLLRAMLNFAVRSEWLIRSPFTFTKSISSPWRERSSAIACLVSTKRRGYWQSARIPAHI
jgi:hypothetical protein